MKKFFMCLAFLFICLIPKAQPSKNTWLLGGSGSLYSYNEDYTYPTTTGTAKYTNIDLSASIGYFFADKFSAGLRPYLSTNKGESSGGANTNEIRLAIGPFARYYFLNTEKQFNLLTDVGYQLGINQANDGANPKGKFNTFSATAGAEFFLNSSIGLEFLVGYKNQVISFDNSPSAFSIETKGIFTSIGFQIHLQK